MHRDRLTETERSVRRAIAHNAAQPSRPQSRRPYQDNRAFSPTPLSAGPDPAVADLPGYGLLELPAKFPYSVERVLVELWSHGSSFTVHGDTAWRQDKRERCSRLDGVLAGTFVGGAPSLAEGRYVVDLDDHSAAIWLDDIHYYQRIDLRAYPYSERYAALKQLTSGEIYSHGPESRILPSPFVLAPLYVGEEKAGLLAAGADPGKQLVFCNLEAPINDIAARLATPPADAVLLRRGLR